MLARAMVVFVCLATASVAIARAERTERVPIRAPFASFPMQLQAWRGIQQAPFDDEILRMLGVDDYLTRVYVGPDRAGVGVYIGYWESQHQGDAIHSPLNCLPGAGWEPVSKQYVQVDLDDGRPSGRRMEVNRYLVQKGLDQELVLYWYQSHGRVVASEYWGKFYLVTDAIRLHRTDAALVRVTAPLVGQGADAERTAEALAMRFVRTLVPALSSYLPD
jgi:EpsI family protein